MLSVGELLRNTREKKGLTLKDVEKETKVREKYLLAIEQNNWDFFTSKVYISGILKSYAKALDLEQSKVMAYFRRDYEKREEFKFKKRVDPINFSPETKKVAIALVASVFIAFSVYFGYQIKLYMTPPVVVITSPTKKVFRNVEQIKVVGKTEKEASIMIFGERVFADREGVFQYDLPLKKGNNNLVVEVTGANGKKTILKKQYLLE